MITSAQSVLSLEHMEEGFLGFVQFVSDWGYLRIPIALYEDLGSPSTLSVTVKPADPVAV